MADPTLPFEPITINGSDYKLCFDINAIADVEERLIARGVEVNLLAARWGALTLSSTRALFIAALSIYQPELTEKEARGLFAQAKTEDVVLAIGETYRQFAPEPEEVKDGDPDPIQPGN